MRSYLESMQLELFSKSIYIVSHFILVLNVHLQRLNPCFSIFFRSIVPPKSLFRHFFLTRQWNLNITYALPIWLRTLILSKAKSHCRYLFFHSSKTSYCPLGKIKIHRLDEILRITEHICIIFLWGIKIINHSVSFPEIVLSLPLLISAG